MKTINCAECNVEYSYEPNPNYPDKRKYCANCSEKKKASWDERTEPIAETVPMNPPVDYRESALKAVDKAYPKKEFHLSPEQVRTNALECAIAIYNLPLKPKEFTGDITIMSVAKAFEEYLWNGK